MGGNGARSVRGGNFKNGMGQAEEINKTGYFKVGGGIFYSIMVVLRGVGYLKSLDPRILAQKSLLGLL